MSTKNNESMLNLLRKMVQEMGTQKAVADHLGVSQMYISDMLNYRRDVSENVAKKLGYQRVVQFKEMEKE